MKRNILTYEDMTRFRYELLQTEMFEVAHGMYLKLKGTEFYLYPGGNLYGPASMWRRNRYEAIGFEEVLDQVSSEIQVKLLYHLDLVVD